jgi:hypothetical protein
MALTDKLKRVFANRYTPFFLPVIGSLVYIGLAILFIPETFDGGNVEESDATDTSTATSPVGSGITTPEALSPSAKRRARLTNRAVRSSTTSGLSNPAGAPMPPAAMPPAPMPASPDGAD